MHQSCARRTGCEVQRLGCSRRIRRNVVIGGDEGRKRSLAVKACCRAVRRSACLRSSSFARRPRNAAPGATSEVGVEPALPRLHLILRASLACHMGDLDSQNRRRSTSMKSILMGCAVIGALSLTVSPDSIAAGRSMAGGTPMASQATVSHQAPTQTTIATTRSPAHTTGQPSQTCGSASAPNTPGNAAMAPGSAFNSTGKAGSVYAGQQPHNSRNTASTSQYDVACSHQP
jgi:hypothetical protein